MTASSSSKDKKEERNKKHRHSPSNKYDRQPYAGNTHDRQVTKWRYTVTTTQGTSNKYDMQPDAKTNMKVQNNITMDKQQIRQAASCMNKHDRQLAKGT